MGTGFGAPTVTLGEDISEPAENFGVGATGAHVWVLCGAGAHECVLCGGGDHECVLAGAGAHEWVVCGAGAHVCVLGGGCETEMGRLAQLDPDEDG